MGAHKMVNKISRINLIFIMIALVVGVMVVDHHFRGPIADAKSTEYFNAPASFNHLAEIASPAVVNIRTVKTIKGGGPVFRQFQRDPWEKTALLKNFLNAISAMICSANLNNPASDPDLSWTKPALS